MATGAGLDVYSGVARASGRIWASRHKSTKGPADTAVIVVHPASNFLGHYMLGSLANCGVDAIGLCTRYIGNDSSLLMENCVLDIGAAIRHLREDGYQKIVLIGNSGGGGLAALYESQAESPTIVATPAGDPPDLTKADLPPADGLIFLMAHPGRSIVFTEWFDPAITDELCPLERDPSLDMFLAENGPPFDAAFLSRYREAQIARNRRVTAWVREQLDILAARGGGLRDLPFAVHGTVADPRMVDLSIDPSDREATTPWGPASVATYTPVSLGHQASLRSWLSQWSFDESNGDGRVQATRVDAPVLVMYGSADEVCYPSHAQSLYDAVPHSRKELQRVDGATHYFVGRKDLVDEAAGRIVEWITRSV
jgi:alpha-beta hydrolase superfamily lysophospholipase